MAHSIYQVLSAQGSIILHHPYCHLLSFFSSSFIYPQVLPYPVQFLLFLDCHLPTFKLASLYRPSKFTYEFISASIDIDSSSSSISFRSHSIPSNIRFFCIILTSKFWFSNFYAVVPLLSCLTSSIFFFSL